MKDSSPAISVIIPAYNAEEFLSECLESLRIQTFDDFEVLFVDDGSTDRTSDIASDFAEGDKRFKYIPILNGGVSHARNKGIDLAKGKYITFVDADDLLYPDALKDMYECMEYHDADVCITGFQNSRTQGEFKRSKRQAETYNYEQAMKHALYQKRILNAPWGVMIRRSLLGDSRRFREDTRYEDLDAFYRFYEGASKIIYLPSKYYFYRKNIGSFINNWSRSRLDVLDVTDRMTEYIRLNYPTLLKAAEDRRFSAHFNILMLMYKNKINDAASISRCISVIKEGRRRALADRNVRFKNKLGALLAYGGTPMLKLLSKF